MVKEISRVRIPSEGRIGKKVYILIVMVAARKILRRKVHKLESIGFVSRLKSHSRISSILFPGDAALRSSLQLSIGSSLALRIQEQC